jgi:signal transduction histidine kinase
VVWHPDARGVEGSTLSIRSQLMPGRFTLQRALLGTVAVALLLGIVPAGIALDRTLVSALLAKARTDLEMAPGVLADRTASRVDMLRMHAADVARIPGLADALARGDSRAVQQLIETNRALLGGGEALVVDAAGHSIVGPSASADWLDETRRGNTPAAVGVERDRHEIMSVALAPIESGGRWAGAVGVIEPMDERAADALARLTRSDITVLVGANDSVAVTTLDTAQARALRGAFTTMRDSARAHDVPIRDRTLIAVAAPLGRSSRVIFSRSRDAELAVVPQLHRVAGVSALVALAVALLLGAWLSARVSRPARELAEAASGMARGSFDVPLPQSRIEEIARVAAQFADMRAALARQMAELREANEALAERNARLVTLQADLMQRDRLAATGRLVANLAHEIRNPVANLRNLLELIRRRASGDPQVDDYAELAIDELLRMHELAEQMLDLNRPRDPKAQRADAPAVAREVARLATAGAGPGELDIVVAGTGTRAAGIAPDALKQVLLNLVQNAREAVTQTGDGVPRIAIDVRDAEDGIVIRVSDNGPGVPVELKTRIFDPFFTTKSAVDGVGLGLFVAEGLVRSAGGRLTLDQSQNDGATFVIELPAASPESALSPDTARVATA